MNKSSGRRAAPNETLRPLDRAPVRPARYLLGLHGQRVPTGAAVPASARVPGGQGLESFGFADCGSLGQVEVFGAPTLEASTFYLIIP
jgi:hypothetical protein